METTQFKRTRPITLPTFSHKKNPTFFLKFMEEIHEGRQMPPKKDRDGKDLPPEKPADVAKVTNLQTGELGEYLVPTTVKRNLTETVKDYVGKCYEITRTGRREGKRYDDYVIFEIEEPKSDESDKAASSKKK